MSGDGENNEFTETNMEIIKKSDLELLKSNSKKYLEERFGSAQAYISKAENAMLRKNPYITGIHLQKYDLAKKEFLVSGGDESLINQFEETEKSLVSYLDKSGGQL